VFRIWGSQALLLNEIDIENVAMRLLLWAACLAVTLFLIAMLGGCESKGYSYEPGYSDGYAAAINTACRFRATMVWGHYGYLSYAKGYAKGAAAGTLAIADEGCQALR
jgi:hypothetical protein